jgi:hypothetical protein
MGDSDGENIGLSEGINSKDAVMIERKSKRRYWS